MIADPAREQDPVPGAQRRRGETGARIAPADPGRADVHAVGVAALDDLGVAGDDLDPGRAGGVGDRPHLAGEHVGGQPLLEDQREREGQRPGAGHGEVVDGAVDGQFTDRATGEAQRLDDVGVGAERELLVTEADHSGVAHLGQRVAAQRGGEQALDQRLGRLAARAVGHRDPLVTELGPFAAGGADDAQDALLAVGDDRAGARVGHHTTSRSRAKRPKL